MMSEKCPDVSPKREDGLGNGPQTIESRINFELLSQLIYGWQEGGLPPVLKTRLVSL
jgi:hypothetical protein